MIQKKYAKNLAQDAVNEGLLKGWALLRRVDTGKAQEINYLWVHVFKMSKKWLIGKLLGGLMKKNMVFHQIFYMVELEGKNYGNFFYKTEKRYDNNLEAKYVLFNWAFPKNLNSSMALADKISSGFKNSMKKRVWQVGGWQLELFLKTQNMPSVFWDAYETQEQVMNHLMNEAIVGTVDKKLIDQLLQELPNGWDNKSNLGICY